MIKLGHELPDIRIKTLEKGDIKNYRESQVHKFKESTITTKDKSVFDELITLRFINLVPSFTSIIDDSTFTSMDTTAINVINLPNSTSHEELFNLFKTYGEIKKAHVKFDIVYDNTLNSSTFTSQNKGVVQFINQDSASNCLSKFTHPTI